MSSSSPRVATVAAAEKHRDGPGTGSRPGASRRALFVLYVVLLVWIVLWKLERPWVGGHAVVKLVPFVAAGGSGGSRLLEVLGNLLLFVPFGVHLGLLAPTWSWWRIAGAAAGVSLALETGQYVLGVGSSDVTDLVVNTAGGLAGLGVLVLARGTLGGRTTGLVTVVCSVGTALVVLGSGVYLLSPVHHLPVRDVGPLVRIEGPGGG